MPLGIGDKAGSASDGSTGVGIEPHQRLSAAPSQRRFAEVVSTLQFHAVLAASMHNSPPASPFVSNAPSPVAVATEVIAPTAEVQIASALMAALLRLLNALLVLDRALHAAHASATVTSWRPAPPSLHAACGAWADFFVCCCRPVQTVLPLASEPCYRPVPAMVHAERRPTSEAQRAYGTHVTCLLHCCADSNVPSQHIPPCSPSNRHGGKAADGRCSAGLWVACNKWGGRAHRTPHHWR